MLKQVKKHTYKVQDRFTINNGPKDALHVFVIVSSDAVVCNGKALKMKMQCVTCTLIPCAIPFYFVLYSFM